MSLFETNSHLRNIQGKAGKNVSNSAFPVIFHLFAQLLMINVRITIKKVMANISEFRLGNYALFDGELQKIDTPMGLENSAFLDPLPITSEVFKRLDYAPLRKNSDCYIYSFQTLEDDAIEVIFNTKLEFLIMEKVSQIEYPFIKWIHEIQNLIADKKAKDGSEVNTTKSIHTEITIK